MLGLVLQRLAREGHKPRQERFILAAPPYFHFFVLPPCRATWCVLAAFPARSYQAVWSGGGAGRHQGTKAEQTERVERALMAIQIPPLMATSNSPT